MTWSGFAACFSLLVLTLLSGESLHVGSLPGWLSLIVLTLVSHILDQSFITFALAHAHTAFSSVGLLLQAGPCRPTHLGSI